MLITVNEHRPQCSSLLMNIDHIAHYRKRSKNRCLAAVLSKTSERSLSRWILASCQSHTTEHYRHRKTHTHPSPPPTPTPLPPLPHTHRAQAVGAYSLPTGQVRVRGQVHLAFAVRGAGSSDHRDKRTWVRRSPPPLSAPRLCALPLETVVSSRVPVETNIYRPLLL